jgi:hypothetical protein
VIHHGSQENRQEIEESQDRSEEDEEEVTSTSGGMPSDHSGALSQQRSG